LPHHGLSIDFGIAEHRIIVSIAAGVGEMSLMIAYLADRPEAVPQIARWWFDEWGHLRPGASIQDLSARLRGQLNRDQIPVQIIAVRDEQVVGVAVLKLHEMVDLYPEKRFWLGNVFVAPEFRGRGIASTLATKIVEVAKSQSVDALHLQTESLNGGLYAHLGWEKVEQVHYKGYDALVMVKRL
jgi:GNAT superfamily N-acetyltransferase